MSTWKYSLLLLLLPALSFGIGPRDRRSSTERLMNSAHPLPTQKLSKEESRNQLNQTMALMEPLASQLSQASLSETAEVWDSGETEFGFKRGVVESCKKSAEKLGKALALENEGKSREALELREDAREALRYMHRETSEDFLTELRGWLAISEGMLRREREADARALALSKASAEAQAKAATHPAAGMKAAKSKPAAQSRTQTASSKAKVPAAAAAASAPIQPASSAPATDMK